MASLREQRRKIKSVRSTQQITKAMKMVAAARVRRAQSAILASRPFAVKLEETVRKLAALETAARATGEALDLPALFVPQGTGRSGLFVVTSDKGLCGSFNANLLRYTAGWLRRNQGKTISLFVVGRKGRDFLKRLKDVPMEVETELVGIFPKVSFAHAEILGKAMTDAFTGKKLEKVTAVYNEFKSLAAQKIVEKPLLPLAVEEGKTPEPARFSEEYRYWPGRHELLGALLPRYLKAQLYRILLESQAAELAARMNAMDAASKNAGELISSLTLDLNRTRQAIITKELSEIVAGAEALAQ